MANPFRQQSRFRKLVYFGLILALFTGSLVYRRFVIEPEATALQLREQTRGEVDLTSSAVQLSLLGSRGVATTGLWYIAKEKQAKNQWNELELVVRSITKLQPHFAAPWRYLSWNLAFNVAVECDRTRDKYFYISRGLELLAEGERRNQGTQDDAGGRSLRFPGNPDMRYDLAFFYRLKIDTSDEKHFMRCLLDLSCIDPVQRDPKLFWGVDERGRRFVKQAEFKDFCKSYPRLVRRLRDHLGRSRPADVVAFLEDNKDVPSRFDAPPDPQADHSPLRKPRDQFPVLPNPNPLPPNLPDPTRAEFPFSFDVNRASEAWYVYAQEPLPPPDPDEAIRPRPFDAIHYRLPKISTMIFRGFPARAKFHEAEALQEEGWFDEKDGWKIRDWFEVRPGSTQKRDVTVGAESKYRARPAWQRAYDAYLDYGRKTGIYFTPAELRDLEAKAGLYRSAYRLRQGDRAPGLKREHRKGPLAEGLVAHQRLQWQAFNRNLTNFDGFLYQALVDKEPAAIAVRKQFFQARELAMQAARAQAVKKFEEAFAGWEELLLAHPGFRRIGNVQIETYEKQTRYLEMRQQQQADRLGPLVLGVLQFGMAHPGVPLPAGLPVLELDTARKNALIPLRSVRGRFEMLYIYEVPDVGQDELDLAHFLLGVTQAALPVPLALSPHQKNHMLVIWTPADMPEALLYNTYGWKPLLSDGSVDQLRRQRAAMHGPREQPPAAAQPRQ
jgi:hypothetical protein